MKHSGNFEFFIQTEFPLKILKLLNLFQVFPLLEMSNEILLLSHSLLSKTVYLVKLYWIKIFKKNSLMISINLFIGHAFENKSRCKIYGSHSILWQFVACDVMSLNFNTRQDDLENNRNFSHEIIKRSQFIMIYHCDQLYISLSWLIFKKPKKIKKYFLIYYN